MQKMTIRRICILLLALCLLPVAGLAREGAPPARQAFQRELMDDNDFVLSFLPWEGQTLILTQKVLYTWQRDAALRRLADKPPVQALFAHAGQVMALDGHSGMVYRLNLTGDAAAFEEALQLDWGPFTQREAPNIPPQPPRFALAHEGQLYAIWHNYGDLKQDLYSFDLVSGQRRSYTQTMLQSLVPYRDGLLMGLHYNQRNHDSPPQVMAFDPAADTAKPLPLRLPNAGPNAWPGDMPLYYDAAQDAVYAVTQTAVLRLRENADPIQTDRLPLVDFWGGGWQTTGPRMQAAGEDELLIAAGWNLYLRGTDEAKLKPAVTLVFSQFFDDEKAMALALAEMEGVQAETHGYVEPEQLNAWFLTGEAPVDLLQLDTSNIRVEKLMQKGYLLDLSDVPELAAMADDALPAFDGVLRHDGRLYAVPHSLDTWFNIAVPQHLAAVGRTAPRTFDELAELVRWWSEEGHEQHEDYALFSYLMPDAKTMLKDMVYTAYINAMQGQGLPLQFSEQPFGRAIRAIDALDIAGWGTEITQSADSRPAKPLLEITVAYEQDSLMYGGLGEHNGEPMLLSPDGQMPGWRHANGRLLAAPARTKHPEEVREFLRLYVQYLSPLKRAALSRSWSKPVPNPRYEEMMQNTEQAMAGYQQEIDKAEGAQRREMEANLAHMQARYERDREAFRYLFTREGLLQHRERMAHVYVDNSLTITQRDALSLDGYLWGMYMDGAISLEQFMQQANDKIRLMVMEGK